MPLSLLVIYVLIGLALLGSIFESFKAGQKSRAIRNSVALSLFLIFTHLIWS